MRKLSLLLAASAVAAVASYSIPAANAQAPDIVIKQGGDRDGRDMGRDHDRRAMSGEMRGDRDRGGLRVELRGDGDRDSSWQRHHRTRIVIVRPRHRHHYD